MAITALVVLALSTGAVVLAAEIRFQIPPQAQPMAWNDSNNWDLGRVPGPLDDVIIASGPDHAYSVLFGYHLGLDELRVRSLTVGGGGGEQVYLDVNGQLEASSGITLERNGNLNLRKTTANANVTAGYMVNTTLLYVSEGAKLVVGEGSMRVSDRLQVDGTLALRRDTTQLVPDLDYRLRLPRPEFNVLVVTTLHGLYAQSFTGTFEPWIGAIANLEGGIEIPGESSQFYVDGHARLNGTLTPLGVGDVGMSDSEYADTDSAKVAPVIGWQSREGLFHTINPVQPLSLCGPATCNDVRCQNCEENTSCMLNTECHSNVCEVITGWCVDPCHDGVANFEETYQDCGGGTCQPCAANQLCAVSEDCWNSVPGTTIRNRLDCVEGICRGCGDGILNLNEPVLDKGAECTIKCAPNDACFQDTDCEVSTCVGGGVCASCDDGELNFNETALDCGGPFCTQGCSLNEACEYHNDCDQTFSFAGPGGITQTLRCDLDSRRCVLIDATCYIEPSPFVCGGGCVPCEDYDTSKGCSVHTDCLNYRGRSDFGCGDLGECGSLIISAPPPTTFVFPVCTELNTGGLVLLFTRGTCTPACPFGWAGSACDLPLCAPIAAAFFAGNPVDTLDNCNRNGVCTPNEDPPVCVCASGWRGSDCTTLDCPGSPDCSGKGMCVEGTAGGECQCDPNWDGVDCSTAVCADDCNGRGSCNGESGTPVCVCTVDGWGGPTCSDLVCPQADGQTCNGHGNCAAHTDGVRGGQCTCEDGWTGEACAEFLCAGTPECNAPHGVCVLRQGVPECDCALLYSGSACEVYTGPSPSPSPGPSPSPSPGPAPSPPTQELCPVNGATGFRCSTLPCDEAVGVCRCEPFFSGEACETAVCGADFLHSEAAVFRILLELDFNNFDEVRWRNEAATLMGVVVARVCILNSWRGSVGMEVAVAPSSAGSNDAQPAVDQLFQQLSTLEGQASVDGALYNVTTAERVVIAPTDGGCSLSPEFCVLSSFFYSFSFVFCFCFSCVCFNHLPLRV
jgi:hypothetical protein